VVRRHLRRKLIPVANPILIVQLFIGDYTRMPARCLGASVVGL